MNRIYLNKGLLSVAVLIATFSLHSCSLLHSFSSAKKRDVPVADTARSVSAVVPHNRILLPEPDTLSAVPDTAGLMRKLVDMVSPIFNSRLQYRTFSGKARVHFESPEDKQDFTAAIRLKKDTAIWVDITALGGMFHAARVLITPDSLFMINYQQKSVSRLPLKDVAKILPTSVDFQSLQRLVTGEPLRDGSITDVAVLGASWLLHVNDGSYTQSLEYRKADSLLINDQVATLAPGGPQATLRYDNFEHVGDKKLAISRSVSIVNGNDRFLLEMEIEDPEFDKQLEMPFNVPKNYSTK